MYDPDLHMVECTVIKSHYSTHILK